MNLFRRIRIKSRDQKAEKYMQMLLTGKIRLEDVPLCLRRDPRRCSEIYITAFRVDRGTARSHYAYDLAILRVEIARAKQDQERALYETLVRVREYADWGLNVCPEG